MANKRLTLRLTADQIRDIRVAAALNYMTVSEWAADQAKRSSKYAEVIKKHEIQYEPR